MGWRARVVICIRGTLSLDDCLTDAMCEPAEIDDWLLEPDDSNATDGVNGGEPCSANAAAPGAPAPSESNNSLMSGARNSPHKASNRPESFAALGSALGAAESNGVAPHWEDRAKSGADAGTAGQAADGWQPLKGPLGGRAGAGGSSAEGSGGAGASAGADRGLGRSSDGGGSGGEEKRPQRPSRRGSFGAQSFSTHTPPPVQVWLQAPGIPA